MSLRSKHAQVILLAALTLMPLGASAAPPIGDPDAPMDVATWLDLAARGELPTACQTRSLELPASVLGALPQGVGTADHMGTNEACTGIRPGGELSNVGCTMNFVYSSGSTLFIGTAGHCSNNNAVANGQRMSTAATGPFGTVVFRAFSGTDDFTLIRIDASKVGLVNARMCAFGGPAGVRTTPVGLNEELHEYGWGSATFFAAQTRARQQFAFFDDDERAIWNGIGSSGDSGAPVTDSANRAYAIHTMGVTPGAGVVAEGGPTVARILELTAAAGFNLQVVNG